MEPEWMKWCKENMEPAMFNEMQSEHRYSARWRDGLIDQLKKALQSVLDTGHNDDCMFCGFKDKKATEALAEYKT